MVANGVITADQVDSCAIYLPWLLVTSKDLVDSFAMNEREIKKVTDVLPSYGWF